MSGEPITIDEYVYTIPQVGDLRGNRDNLLECIQLITCYHFEICQSIPLTRCLVVVTLKTPIISPAHFRGITIHNGAAFRPEQQRDL